MKEQSKCLILNVVTNVREVDLVVWNHKYTKLYNLEHL